MVDLIDDKDELELTPEEEQELDKDQPGGVGVPKNSLQVIELLEQQALDLGITDLKTAGINGNREEGRFELNLAACYGIALPNVPEGSLCSETVFKETMDVLVNAHKERLKMYGSFAHAAHQPLQRLIVRSVMNGYWDRQLPVLALPGAKTCFVESLSSYWHLHDGEAGVGVSQMEYAAILMGVRSAISFTSVYLTALEKVLELAQDIHGRNKISKSSYKEMSQAMAAMIKPMYYSTVDDKKRNKELIDRIKNANTEKDELADAIKDSAGSGDPLSDLAAISLLSMAKEAMHGLMKAQSLVRPDEDEGMKGDLSNMPKEIRDALEMLRAGKAPKAGLNIGFKDPDEDDDDDEDDEDEDNPCDGCPADGMVSVSCRDTCCDHKAPYTDCGCRGDEKDGDDDE